MYQTPNPTPPRRWGPDLTLELVIAVVLTVAVALGLIATGSSGRFLQVAVLLLAAGAAGYTGWPVSGYIALGAAAVYLALEAAFGRLDGTHSLTELVLTVGTAGAVLAAGFANGASERERPRVSIPTPKLRRRETKAPPEEAPAAAEPAEAKRLTAGTLEYEIERARECNRPLGLLAVQPDGLDALADAAGAKKLALLLDLLDVEIESTVRAIDVIDRSGKARFQVILPETGPEGARTVAERIRLRVDSTRPERSLGLEEGLTFSVGVAAYPEDGADESALEAAAERALARAGELGGNRTVLHSVPPGAPPGWGLSAVAGTTPLQQPR